MRGMTGSAGGTQENPGRNLRRKAGLNRSLQDASFRELVRQIAYKANLPGRNVGKVDGWFAFSEACGFCSHMLAKLDLEVRQRTRLTCDAAHERGRNAARNIERAVLLSLHHSEDTWAVPRHWRRRRLPHGRVSVNRCVPQRRRRTAGVMDSREFRNG
jgi:transposase